MPCASGRTGCWWIRWAFPPEDIIFDPNVLTVGTGIEQHNEYGVAFIEATRWIKANLPHAKVSGGISNVSFSFRGNNAVREAMHAAFLYHAIRAGLDMGIVNPSQLAVYAEIEPELLDRVEDVLLNRRADATERMLTFADGMKEAGSGKKDVVKTERRLRPEVQAALKSLEATVNDIANVNIVNEGVWANLGATYHSLGMFNESEQAFRNAIDQAHKLRNVFFADVIIALVDCGREDDAENLIQCWLSIDRFSRRLILKEIIYVSTRLKRYVDALPYLRQLPDDWEKIGDIAEFVETLARNGLIEEASQLMKQSERSWEVDLRFARGLAEGGFLKEAQTVLNKVLDSEPPTDEMYFLFRLGATYMALGDITEGNKYLDASGFSTTYKIAFLETVSRYHLLRKDYQVAIQYANQMGASFDGQNPYARFPRLKLLADIAVELGHEQSSNAITLIGQLHGEALSEFDNRSALLSIAEAATKLRVADVAIKIYIDLYNAYVNIGSAQDWVVVVARAIAAQAKAGLAYEEVPVCRARSARGVRPSCWR